MKSEQYWDLLPSADGAKTKICQSEMLCSSRRFGGGQQRPPRTVEVPLKLTLKELYTGTTKRLKITRRVYNKQTGKLEPKEVQPRALSAAPPASCVPLCLQELHT